MHIVADEAYLPLSAECGGQILMPFSQHQLNTAKKKDWQSQQGWEDCMAHNSTLPRFLSFWWPWFDLTLQA
jgi:hypothetical protein